jgi:hypothetical protein
VLAGDVVVFKKHKSNKENKGYGNNCCAAGEELKLLKEFLQKNPIKNRVLNEEDKEDLVLGLMMQETDYKDTIDRNEFIKQLQGK